MVGETKAVQMVAELMAISARTAPKGRGQDSIITRIAVDEDLKRLAGEMRRLGELTGIKALLRDAGNMDRSDACLLIGCKGSDVTGLNCGGCGFASCNEMLEAQNAPRAAAKRIYSGPNCAIKMADLGIALGSAAKTASIHNVDNRIMFTAGVGALSLGWLNGCNIAYGVPLKASGKSIYFDREG